jgi:NAD(P)-dependent dehydrogenase (short-subunit alcohol dehydrogenase family)
VVAGIRALGRQAVAVQADVADEAQVRSMFQQVDAQLGRLDHLVNNAGIVVPAARLDAQDLARWQRVFGVNVMGTMLCCREAVRRMSTRHGGAGGCIVNLSSRAAIHGSPDLYVDYAASKAAIDTLTVGLAKELILEGIRVNGVRPGVIATEIHADSGLNPQTAVSGIPIGRLGSAQEIAEGVLWLLSPASSYCVGTMLDVAGGR